MRNHHFCFSWNKLLFNFYKYRSIFFLSFYEKFLIQLFFSIFFFFFGIFTLSLIFYSFFPFNLFLSFLQVKYMSVARESMNKVYQTDDGTYVLHYLFWKKNSMCKIKNKKIIFAPHFSIYFFVNIIASLYFLRFE